MELEKNPSSKPRHLKRDCLAQAFAHSTSFSKPWTINKEASSSAPIISLKSSFELVFALNCCATLDFFVKNASFIGKASSSKKAFTFRFRIKKKRSDAPEVFYRIIRALSDNDSVAFLNYFTNSSREPLASFTKPGEFTEGTLTAPDSCPLALQAGN